MTLAIVARFPLAIKRFSFHEQSSIPARVTSFSWAAEAAQRDPDCLLSIRTFNLLGRRCWHVPAERFGRLLLSGRCCSCAPAQTQRLEHKTKRIRNYSDVPPLAEKEIS